jgi:hypothetical protein
MILGEDWLLVALYRSGNAGVVLIDFLVCCRMSMGIGNTIALPKDINVRIINAITSVCRINIINTHSPDNLNTYCVIIVMG